MSDCRDLLIVLRITALPHQLLTWLFVVDCPMVD